MLNAVKSFLRDEEGAQIIEYALIIAVVSIALILALQGLSSTNFAAWITKVGSLLSTGALPAN